ncbi:MAG TPA: phospholipase D-like domain-containing protein [Candidatus Acidoferrum sp.]|nr:phospholipase D-like domain-containing protein [Candidatus Acidoferrum sp.]
MAHLLGGSHLDDRRGLPHAGRYVRLPCLVLLVSLLIPSAVLASEAYFSPRGGVRQRLLRAIEASQQTIDIAVYSFTASELAEALYAAKARGVHVRILVDREMAEEGVVIRAIRRKGLEVRSLGVPQQSLMHNKFAVFDDRLVATGSYNWTNSAEHANYENLVVLDDPEVIGRFQREFRRLWREAKE